MKNAMKAYCLFFAVLFLISFTLRVNETDTSIKAYEQDLSGSKLVVKSVMNGNKLEKHVYNFGPKMSKLV